MLVWPKSCSSTISAILRIGDQEKCSFPVFPSPRISYFKQGGKTQSRAALSVPAEEGCQSVLTCCGKSRAALQLHCSTLNIFFSSNAKALRFSTKMRMQLICELYMASLKKWLLQLITRSTSVIAVFGTLLCTGPSNVRNQ